MHDGQHNAKADLSEPQTKCTRRKERLVAYLRSSRFKLYCSFALSSAGDRMWIFALSLAMFKISGDLRLTAIAMAANGLGVICFAAALGRWIDRTPRFRAAVKVLAANNIAVVLSAGILALTLFLGTARLGERLRIILIVLSIACGAASLLANIGNNIIVKKDWVVEMARGDSAKLSRMNATLVAIDQTCIIVAPIIAGQLMTSTSVEAGCLFIAAWNVLSFFLELYLLWLVYKKTPALNEGHNANVLQSTEQRNSRAATCCCCCATAHSNAESGNAADDSGFSRDKKQHSWKGKREEQQENRQQRRSGCLKVIANVLKKNVVDGWRAYRRQPIFPAAFGLALLYFTVLSFDSITTGYAYAQGLQENILAILRGCGAVCGILGTFGFPHLRKRVGLQWAGVISFLLQISCLNFCVTSIFLPGSPFDAVAYFSTGTRTAPLNYSAYLSSKTSFNITEAHQANLFVQNGEEFGLAGRANYGLAEIASNAAGNATSGEKVANRIAKASIWTFVIGVIAARFGLWMTDLAITQIMQQTIIKEERGIVNGVQSAIQQMMGMLKSVAVIALPRPETFGLLIIISFITTCSAFVSFLVYAKQHLDRLCSTKRLSRAFANRADKQDTRDVHEPSRTESSWS